MISPSTSAVVVFTPSFITASYSLSWLIKYLDIFVAFPNNRGNTPVAFGSNVPVCPTFVFNIFFTFFTISLDVRPFDLFITNIPFIISSLF